MAVNIAPRVHSCPTPRFTRWLVVSLLYSPGMRLLEGLRLRVKDVDFERCEITVRDGKGARDRVTMMPARLVEPLQQHLARVRALHERDLAEGYGEIHLPFALARKYPKAGRSWIRGRTEVCS